MLYNFFSETLPENKRKELELIEVQLSKFCLYVKLIKIGDKNTLIGQIEGSEAYLSNTDFIKASGNVKYYWFDAFEPKNNNVE